MLAQTSQLGHVRPPTAPARSTARCARPARAFTLIEAVAITLVACFALLVLLPAMPRRHGCGARQLKDAAQVKNVLMAMSTWAASNKGAMPLPSAIDINNHTVPELATAKETTANMLSILVWNNSVPCEFLVSPAESSPSIGVNTTYQFAQPAAAVDPAKALWDPSFKADFTAGTAHNSYAVMQACGSRAAWLATGNSSFPILGNRAPNIASIRYAAKGQGLASPVLGPPQPSNTLLIHGGRNTWEGHIAYADGHVNFETSLMPIEASQYVTTGGVRQPDCPFFDEPDSVVGKNAYLGIFTTAGTAPSQWRAIHD